VSESLLIGKGEGLEQNCMALKLYTRFAHSSKNRFFAENKKHMNSK